MSGADSGQQATPQSRANPVAMFSAPGHRDTIWSDVKGSVIQSRQITCAGVTAATHRIDKVTGAAAIRTQSLGLQFSWNSGYVEADAESKRQVRAYKNRPRYGLVLPPDTAVEFRIKEKSNYRFMAIEFEPKYLSETVEIQHRRDVEFIEAWDYNHPLTWELATVISDECESNARQGLLYAETALTLLALHVVRNFSNHQHAVAFSRRGGLSPRILRRACEYMVSRLAEDVSLSEIAELSNLSTGHFSVAFKQSMGVAPHAWLRRQRIDRAKFLLRHPELTLASIATVVGFANQSAFGIAFKKETGLSPMAWRRLHWL
jgi:AraC family transcriptional regulator